MSTFWILTLLAAVIFVAIVRKFVSLLFSGGAGGFLARRAVYRRFDRRD